MSFSADVKKELGNSAISDRDCIMAELAAIFICCGVIDRSNNKLILYIKTDQQVVAERFSRLIDRTFHYKVETIEHISSGSARTHYICEMFDEDINYRAVHSWKLDLYSGKLYEQDIEISETLITNSSCKRAFLSGTFMCCGTMSTPEKHYHFEYVTIGAKKARQLMEVIKFFDIEPKETIRRNNYIVYIKDGAQVSDMLTIMQATVSMLEYENIRIKREIRGNVNRKVNCETANINKTVAAAIDQIKDIELIESTIGWSEIPRELYETAMMRLSNTDAPLKSLGEMMNPPVGKSGMNHRFHKIKEIAEQIRKDGNYTV